MAIPISEQELAKKGLQRRKLTLVEQGVDFQTEILEVVRELAGTVKDLTVAVATMKQAEARVTVLIPEMKAAAVALDNAAMALNNVVEQAKKRRGVKSMEITTLTGDRKKIEVTRE